jgi:hypothetical protein
MKKIIIALFVAALISGCGGAAKFNMAGHLDNKGKLANLKYTKTGLTSEFLFKGIASGTYKSYGAKAGLVYYAGSKNIKLTVKAKEEWSIKAESKSQSFQLKSLGVDLDNPYIGTVKRGSKTIGHIGISMPKVDKTKTALKYVGLDSIIQRNLHLKGSANILGKKYKISSVYEDKAGQKRSHPYGYSVSRGNKTLGLVQVGKNAFGGQKLQLWVAPNLNPITEQSVVATLLVAGYAI